MARSVLIRHIKENYEEYDLDIYSNLSDESRLKYKKALDKYLSGKLALNQVLQMLSNEELIELFRYQCFEEQENYLDSNSENNYIDGK